MDLLEFFLSGIGIVIALLIALIPLLIAIGLIIAIFQINGRIGEILRIQRIATTQTLQEADLQRQAFIAHLAAHGPNHKEYLDYLVSLNYLTQDQADFVYKQSGHKIIES
jgi:hypothetical protein